ncbi:PucR family transcriptional regulator ligand-binding domain-containing protein [Streptomonospora sp. S1-112]|uniref:PucR family transcriptional regulator ligand-binding domain-containing protein n=1 Tax=Streptomonospora mangrovi TaxID=2883123 RepID=A0A9X3NIR3_9ACTN|nr:PucR family transcriptional regulator ligand-binding domain-containing protein [Streptomonospora mangrovi]MDA0562771.1 PucR family transcriptional regulator ligand-binding domain-containing protein [Streptomonospora mangrovi]
MLPTLADVLALPAVQRARPRVVVGADRLGGTVRWVHIAEVTDLAHLLRGGELVLTTGIAMPDDPPSLQRYVDGLASAGVAGIAVELGRKYRTELPPALLEPARAAGIPVICLEREARFVEITEAVHSRVVNQQLAELRESARLHEVFTELSVEGAPPQRVLREIAQLSDCPVVLENLAHQVLVCDLNGEDPGRLLASWEARSRAVRTSGRTVHDAPTGWLVTTVGARGQDWGRLILVCGAAPSPRQTMLLERAATTLALGRLLERHQESLERQTHRTIISGIIDRAYSDPEEALVRARAVGVPLGGRPLVGLVLRLREAGTGLAAQARLADTAEAVARACRELRLAALVGSVDDLRVGVLLAEPESGGLDAALHRLAGRIRERVGAEAVLAAGSTAEDVRDVRRSFLEARQVGDVAAHEEPREGGRPFYRLTDLRLRGLLHLLRDDERVQTYVERELGPLLDHDARHGGDLTEMLRRYLEAGRNKALAASTAHLSRPAFYERLRRISHVLDADLDSVETCLSLHVALLALDSVRGRLSG